MHRLLPTIIPLLSLTTASPISPSTPLLPRDSTENGCTNTSFSQPPGSANFAWSIRDFDYHASETYTTPAHSNSWGYASFNLFNPAIAPSIAVCTASSSTPTDYFYGTIQYNCALPDADAIEGGGRGGRASFDFSRPTGLLRLNQSWSCHDKNPRWPIWFTAYGAVNLTLECETTTYQNPNWTQGSGQIYSDRTTSCQPVTLALEPSDMTAIAR